MAKPKNTIITEEGVITQEALLAYAEGKLSAAETAQMEALLKDDPFAQDALEGMRASAAPAEITSVVTSLNMALREKTGAREKKKKGIEIHWATYAYAAVIVGVLIGLGFVMVHFIGQNEQQIAMNKKATQAEESVPVTGEKPQTQPIPDTTHIAPASGTVTLSDSVSMSLAANGAFADQAANAAPPAPSVITTGIAKDQQPNSAMSGYIAATPSAAKPDAKKNISINGGRADETQYVVNGHRVTGSDKLDKEAETKNKTLNEVSVVSAKKSSPALSESVSMDVAKSAPVSSDMSSAKVSKKEAKAEKAAATIADDLKEGRALFDAGDFKEAAKKYNKVLSDQPENYDALYFGGISDYHNGKDKQAEKNFDKLLKNGMYVDGSKWYKASVLIDRGKKDEAKQLLRDLINTNSSFKDRAVKKYEEIVK